MEKQRFISVDLLRSIAIVLMVIYHFVFDLSFFYAFKIEVFTGGWRAVGRTAAILFLLLVGISFVISNKERPPKKIWKRALQRSCVIFGLGLLITLVTFLYDPNTYIRFGILHLIGLSIIFLPLFRKFRELNLLLGSAVIAAGWQVSLLRAETYLFLPLGIKYPNFASLDYFPLFPWFGVILVGMGLGSLIFVRWNLKPMIKHPFWKILSIPGRYSLWIYMIHQPILFLLFNLSI